MFLNGTLHSLRVPPIFTDEERAKAGQLQLLKNQQDLAIALLCLCCYATNSAAGTFISANIFLQMLVLAGVAFTTPYTQI
jgi:hypothetical protein